MKKATITFSCSIYEKLLLKKRAGRTGMALSEYCRRSVFDHKVVERLTTEQLAAYHMLLKYSNNFKRIRSMFKKDNPKLAEEVEELAEEIKEHLSNFKK